MEITNIKFVAELFVGGVVSVIAYFVKQLVTEHKKSITQMNELLIELRVTQRDMQSVLTKITELAETDSKTHDRITDIIQRLVRLEERSAGLAPEGHHRSSPGSHYRSSADS